MTAPTVPAAPYAAVTDVEAALGRPLDPNLDVSFLLLTASDEVSGYLNGQVPSPLPDVIKRVTAEVVANVINRPQTPPDPTDTAYTVSPFAYQVGPMSVGPWLTASQKLRLNVFRAGGLYQHEVISEVIGSDVSWSILDSFDPYAGTDLVSGGGSVVDTGGVPAGS